MVQEPKIAWRVQTKRPDVDTSWTRQGTRELTAPVRLQAHPARRRLVATGLAARRPDGREHGAGRFPGPPGPASGHRSPMVPGWRRFGGEISGGSPRFPLSRRRRSPVRRGRSRRPAPRGLDPIPGRGRSPLPQHAGPERLGPASPDPFGRRGTHLRDGPDHRGARREPLAHLQPACARPVRPLGPPGPTVAGKSHNGRSTDAASGQRHQPGDRLRRPGKELAGLAGPARRKLRHLRPLHLSISAGSRRRSASPSIPAPTGTRPSPSTPRAGPPSSGTPTGTATTTSI